ncbi:ABC transporter ATP-binding protein [Streptomyces sp. NPDC051180]|uniref:energy-coupling factor ABC transporter ATP-binding protein n=1 Tax=Streptomyces sp. NPDC051180 TaxID=3155797 RepID=UPI00344D8E88
MLRVDSLIHRYPNGTPALDGVSLAVEAGERVAIVGPNGAGKTTLARHLIGLLRPTSGTIEVDGENADRLAIAELARVVGFVFQNPDDQLHASTVAKEVAFGPRNLRFPAERATALVTWALEVTGLTERAGSHPHHLSPDERKRVALASVLAMDTPVLVLDEPTTGQDRRAVRRLEGILGGLAEQGRTIVAVTHDMEFCAENFDRVVVLADGRVRWDGPVERWLEDAADMAEYAFEQPQMTRLGQALGWKEPVATVDRFLAVLESRAGLAG